MTNDQNIKREEPPEYYVGDWCLDLSKADINLSAVQPDVLSYCTVNGELLRVPLAMNPCGIVVNKTLLKDNGLEVLTTYSEFLSVVEALKEKGYTPIQGSEQHVYGELMIGMTMNMLAKDKDATAMLEAGDVSVVDVVKPVFERLTEIIDKGYTDYDLNCTYPADNYDGSIMGFFEGNMPFYVCTAECVSGMKKRESKSETFTAKPFEYEYLYAPVGDEGAYAYTEPWYGFSVNKSSKDKDIAVEFMRFLTTADRLTSMASIKGMPASTTTGTDERYTAMKNQKKLASSFSNDGSVSGNIWAAFMEVCRNLGAGAYASADETTQAFAEQCTLSNVKAF